MINIDVVNEATCITLAQLKPIVAAIQAQVHLDFFPAWGRDANLSLLDSPSLVNPHHWLMTILNNSDQAGALGYHDMTASGLPIGKIFAETDLIYGSSLSVTISHEVMEMLADPWISLQVPDASRSLIYAYEVADACEDDQFGYKRENVLLSDFVYPSYFQDPPPTPAPRYDQLNHISAPFQVLSGGYMSYMDMTNLAKGWQQLVTADKLTAGRKQPGSRTERRRIPPDNRIVSCVRPTLIQVP